MFLFPTSILTTPIFCSWSICQLNRNPWADQPDLHDSSCSCSHPSCPSGEISVHCDASVPIKNPFRFFFRTQGSASSAQEVHRLSVVDTKSHQILAIRITLHHSSFRFSSNCCLFILFHLLLQHTWWNPTFLLPVDSMHHDFISTNQGFSAITGRDVEVVKSHYHILGRQLIKEKQNLWHEGGSTSF